MNKRALLFVVGLSVVGSEAFAASDPELAAHVEALQKKGRLVEAVQALNAAVTRDPKNADAYNGLGNLRLAANDAKLAAAYYMKAIALEPKRADFYSNLGVLEAKIDNPKGALEDFDKALKLDPNLRAALINSGDVLMGLKKFAEAEVFYDRMLKLSPDDAAAHYRKGLSLRSRDQRDAAIKSFAEAVRLQPGYADARADLGFTYLDAGDYEKALRHFQVINAQSKTFTRARYGAGICLKELGRFAEAAEELRWAIVLDPDTPDYRVDLAFALVKQKKPALLAEAEQDLLRGLEAQPNNMRANFLGGLFYDEIGQPEHAVHYYSQAVALKHPNPRVKLFLAQDFLKLGKKGTAMALLMDLVAKLPPEDPVAKQAKALLKAKS